MSRLPRIKHVRAFVVKNDGTGGGADYHDQGDDHWIDDHIATPMAKYPEYRQSRRSFGINVLGTAPKTWTEIGTSCRRSSRLRAVTTMSSTEVVDTTEPSCAACAHAAPGAAQAATVASSAQRRFLFDFITHPPSDRTRLDPCTEGPCQSD